MSAAWDSSATFYKYKSKYGGMEPSYAKRLRALEDENGKLKKVRRIYTAEKRQVRRRGGRKRALGTRKPMVLPAYGNEIMLMVKATALASTITIIEITGMAKRIASQIYQPIETFMVVGAIYLFFNFVVSRLVIIAERRLNPATR